MKPAGVVAIALLSCAHTTPPGTGHLQSLSTGKSVTVDVTFSDHGGHLSCTLPGGETFEGDYQSSAGGGQVYGENGSVTVREDRGIGAGSLVGSNGTVLDCPQLTITNGRRAREGRSLIGGLVHDDVPPHGFGACTDQEGQRYFLRF